MKHKSCCTETYCRRNGTCEECMGYHRGSNSLTKCQKEAKNAGIIIKYPSESESYEMKSKPVWECDVSEFDWFYDSEETCLIIEGEANVDYGDGDVSFGTGDLVVFPKGLSCVWKVLKPIKKHYFFK